MVQRWKEILPILFLKFFALWPVVLFFFWFEVHTRSLAKSQTLGQPEMDIYYIRKGLRDCLTFAQVPRKTLDNFYYMFVPKFCTFFSLPVHVIVFPSAPVSYILLAS